MNIMKHPVIKALVDKGFGFSVFDEKIELTGFYKCGSVQLVLKEGDDEVIIVNQRYDKTSEITTFDELVDIHYSWWLDSFGRWEPGYTKPSSAQWETELKERNLIKTRTVVIYEPTSGR